MRRPIDTYRCRRVPAGKPCLSLASTAFMADCQRREIDALAAPLEPYIASEVVAAPRLSGPMHWNMYRECRGMGRNQRNAKRRSVTC